MITEKDVNEALDQLEEAFLVLAKIEDSKLNKLTTLRIQRGLQESRSDQERIQETQPKHNEALRAYRLPG